MWLNRESAWRIRDAQENVRFTTERRLRIPFAFVSIYNVKERRTDQVVGTGENFSHPRNFRFSPSAWEAGF